MDEYEGEKFRVKLHAAMICTCCCCFGMVLSIGAFFAYSNNVLCAVNENHLLCHSAIIVDTSCIDCGNTTEIYNTTLRTVSEGNGTYNSSNRSIWANESSVLNLNETMIYIANKSIALYSNYIPRDNIEQQVKGGRGGMDAGTAMAISISSVFIFIGCFLSCGWYVKYKPNPIKNMVTNRTASKSIKMTKEEIEISQINPIMKSLGENNQSLLVKAIKNIKEATEKDHSHDFIDAIKLYERGIDQLMVYMKTIVNANERFQMAKKLDMYVQRVIYLKNVVANRELLDVQQKAPAHPVIEKKCVCDANIL